MTIDPFDRHGLTHLSPSSLRLWRECQPVWIAKYMLRAPDDMGPGAWRGTAVEAGVDRLLFGFDAEAAHAAMHNKWNELAQGQVDDACIKEQEALDKFFVSAGVAFNGWPIPLQRQGKVELRVPGISVPIIGYCDWVWADKGTDLKTSWRMPNGGQPDPNHVAQVTCYSMHYGLPFSLTYCSPTRWVRYDVTKAMAERAWDGVIETCLAIRSMLARVENGADALSMFAPNYDSYFFRPAMAEAVRAAKASVPRPAEPRKPELQVVEP